MPISFSWFLFLFLWVLLELSVVGSLVWGVIAILPVVLSFYIVCDFFHIDALDSIQMEQN